MSAHRSAGTARLALVLALSLPLPLPSPVAIARTLVVDAVENTLDLTALSAAGGPAVVTPGEPTRVEWLGGDPSSGPGSPYHDLFVSYAGPCGTQLEVLTEGGVLEFTPLTGDFYAFFTDWSFLGDNSGSLQVALDDAVAGPRELTVDARGNVIRVDDPGFGAGAPDFYDPLTPTCVEWQLDRGSWGGGSRELFPAVGYMFTAPGPPAVMPHATLHPGERFGFISNNSYFYAFFVEIGPRTDNAGRATLQVTQDGDPCAARYPPEPSAVDIDPSIRPLTVVRVAGSVRVEWEQPPLELPSDLHRGVLGNWYRHDGVTCGAHPASATIPNQAGVSSYFIATSAPCDGGASSYGRDSAGAERPTAAGSGGSPCP